MESPDPLTSWMSELRAEMVAPLGSGEAMSLAGDALLAGGATATTAAAPAVAGGGMTMSTTTATLGASAGATLATKVVAASLAATLAIGASAAVTGNLPAGTQSFGADTAARVGIELPRPDAVATDTQIRLGPSGVVDAGVAGSVSATVDASTGLALTGIHATAGFTASIVGQTPESATVRFDSATESTTVLLTTLDGELVATVTSGAAAGAEAGGEIGSEADTSISTDPGAEIEAEAEADVEIGIGIGG